MANEEVFYTAAVFPIEPASKRDGTAAFIQRTAYERWPPMW